MSWISVNPVLSEIRKDISLVLLGTAMGSIGTIYYGTTRYLPAYQEDIREEYKSEYLKKTSHAYDLFKSDIPKHKQFLLLEQLMEEYK